MRAEEYYYGFWQYKTAGIGPFLDHTREFLAGQRTIPVTKTTNEFERRHVFFTFSNSLMRLFIEDIDSLKKPYEVALKYGFRGYSKGGRNGIFYIRDSDKGLRKAILSLVKAHIGAILQDLDIRHGDLGGLTHVKIVSHNPTGKRIVGVFNQKNGRIIFLGFAYH